MIQHEATKAYVDAHFAEDVKFMLGAFGQGRGIEQARPRTGDLLLGQGSSMVLDLGGKLVEIRDFGFAQTGGDLWGWLPAEKILFTGNPVIAEQPAIPWLLDGHLQDVLDTLTRVREFLPADATIVPGHGRPMAKPGLDWHIEYLTTLRDLLDVSQLFVGWRSAQGAGKPRLELKLGRQELSYGEGSLLAIRDLNVRRPFDGAKAIVRTAGWQLDLLAFRPVRLRSGVFDDGADPAQKLWGVWASRPLRGQPFWQRAEVFYLGLDRERARYQQGTARERRHTSPEHRDMLYLSLRWAFNF